MVAPSGQGLGDPRPAPPGSSGPDRGGLPCVRLSPHRPQRPVRRLLSARLTLRQRADGPRRLYDARSIPRPPRRSVGLERLVRSAMGRPGLALRGHPELAPDSRGARSLPRPDPRGPLRGSTALGLPARPPAPGLRLPGAQDSSPGALAPRCTPLTVGSEAGLLGPSPRVASELRIRDVPRGEETPARSAVAPPGHALVLQLPPRPAGRDSGLAP